MWEQWIPVSERQPVENGGKRRMVTVDYPHGQRVVEFGYLYNGEWLDDHGRSFRNYHGCEVVAWQEKPEPYQL